jgi:hypothetical protein
MCEQSVLHKNAFYEYIVVDICWGMCMIFKNQFLSSNDAIHVSLLHGASGRAPCNDEQVFQTF